MNASVQIQVSFTGSKFMMCLLGEDGMPEYAAKADHGGSERVPV